MSGAPSHIWYACYGSNLSAERFYRYLRGGPVPGGTDAQVGAREAALPTGEGTLLTRWELCYGRYSERWGGGAAFLVPPVGDVAEPATAQDAVEWGSMCRLYRLTREQFVDVWLQENGGDPFADGEAIAKLEAVLNKALPTLRRDVVRDPPTEVLALGWYRRLVCLGQREGEWVLTFTSDVEVPFAAPSTVYLDTIKRGLGEAFSELSAAQIEAYVARGARREPR